MVTIKKVSTIIFTQEFILDNPSPIKCLRDSLLKYLLVPWWCFETPNEEVCLMQTSSGKFDLQGRLNDCKPGEKRNQARVFRRTKHSAVHHVKGSVFQKCS